VKRSAFATRNGCLLMLMVTVSQLHRQLRNDF